MISELGDVGLVAKPRRARMGYQYRPDDAGWPPLNPTWNELRQVFRSAPRGRIKHTEFARALNLRSVTVRALFFRGRLPGAIQHTANIILIPKGLLAVVGAVAGLGGGYAAYAQCARMRGQCPLPIGRAARWRIVGVAENKTKILTGNTKMDTEDKEGLRPQSHELSPAGASAPEAAVDVSAVRSADTGGPLVGSTNEAGGDRSRVDELEDLLGGLEEARAGVDLAQSDLSMAEWRVDDLGRDLRDECEVSAELSEARYWAGRAVGEACEALEGLVAALDSRIAARKEQLGEAKGGGVA